MKNGDSIDICGYQIRMEGHILHTDRTEAFEEGNGTVIPKKQFVLALDGEEHEHIIVVDDHLIEIFADHGSYVLSHVIYPAGRQSEKPETTGMICGP